MASVQPTVAVAVNESDVALEVKPDHDESKSQVTNICKQKLERFHGNRKYLSLLLIYFTLFVDMMGATNLVPVLPFLVGTIPHEEALDTAGANPAAAMAIVMVAFNVAQFVSTLAMGPASDRLGRRPVLLCSLFFGAIGYCWQGLAVHLGSFWLFVGARVFTGLCYGTRPVCIAYISDTVPIEQRPKFLGLLALSATLALQLGPLLGGSTGLISLQLPCYVSGAVSLVGFFLVWTFVSESRVLSESKDKQGKPAKAESSAESGDRMVFIVNMFLSFAVGYWVMSNQVAFSLYMPLQFKMDSNQVGLTALGDGVAIFVGNPIYLAMMKKLRIGWVAAIGSFGMAFVAVCPYLDLVPLLSIRYLSTVTGVLAVPSVTAIVSMIAPPSKRGSWAGMTLAVQALGRTVAPLVIGAVFDNDERMPFVIAGAVTFASSIACVFNGFRMGKVGAGTKQDDKQGGDGDDKSVVSELALDAERVVFGLKNEVHEIKKRLVRIQAGLEDEDSFITEITPEERACKREKLGNWLVQHLENHGYACWTEHTDAIKLMLFNSFPYLHGPGRSEEKWSNLIHAFERHIDLAEQILEEDQDLDAGFESLAV